MQSLEFNGLCVEIFAPHALSFAPVPNTLPVASFATPMTQSVQPATSFATSTPLLSSAPIIYLHVLDFGAASMGEIYELVSRQSGAAHLEKFTDELIPRIERHVFGAGKPAWRACAGYSLAGLFSAYAAFASDKFQKIACVSASFWFSGFDTFVAAHSPQRGLAHIYASLGEAEMNPKIRAGHSAARLREILSQNAAVRA